MLTAGFQCLPLEIKTRESKEKARDGEKYLEFIESCRGHPLDTRQWRQFVDLFSYVVITDDAVQVTVKHWGSRKSVREGTRSSKGVGFRDYSLWAENQSQRCKVGWYRHSVWSRLEYRDSLSMASHFLPFQFQSWQRFMMSGVPFSLSSALYSDISLSLIH